MTCPTPRRSSSQGQTKGQSYQEMNGHLRIYITDKVNEDHDQQPGRCSSKNGGGSFSGHCSNSSANGGK